ncbi:hypothetical protein BSZ32_17375 [Rubritalea profundi]|uniref:Uncharacterized protein n=1 Tax=Rubritalea profundi TaxID=1658618 RepID=A0A2S7U789_9BACT|nr:hypothetical protein BSZ32_17375 [Rubritalea profundi]
MVRRKDKGVSDRAVARGSSDRLLGGRIKEKGGWLWQQCSEFSFQTRLMKRVSDDMGVMMQGSSKF